MKFVAVYLLIILSLSLAERPVIENHSIKPDLHRLLTERNLEEEAAAAESAGIQPGTNILYLPLVSNNNMMFYADIIVGDSTHMAIGFDTAVPGNWLITTASSPNKVLNYYTLDSTNSYTINDWIDTEDYHNYTKMYNLVVINGNTKTVNGEFKFSESSEEIKFEFLPIDFDNNSISDDVED